MGEPHFVSALRDKRAEISGMIADLEKELSRRRADLVHVDATLRLSSHPIWRLKASGRGDGPGAMPGSERANARGWCSHCFEPRTVRSRREKSRAGSLRQRASIRPIRRPWARFIKPFWDC